MLLKLNNTNTITYLALLAVPKEYKMFALTSRHRGLPNQTVISSTECPVHHVQKNYFNAEFFFNILWRIFSTVHSAHFVLK